jgi:hypothetical protein
LCKYKRKKSILTYQEESWHEEKSNERNMSMKLKKSTLLLIALFSVSVECMQVKGGGLSDEGSPSSDNDIKDGWQEVSKNGGEEKKHLLLSASSASGSDSEGAGDTEWASKQVNNEPSTTSFNNFASENSGSSTSEESESSEDEEDSAVKEPSSPSWFTVSGIMEKNPIFHESSLPRSMNPLYSDYGKKSYGFPKILGPVAIIVVVCAVLQKLFSGSKKTNNHQPVTSA